MSGPVRVLVTLDDAIDGYCGSPGGLIEARDALAELIEANAEEYAAEAAYAAAHGYGERNATWRRVRAARDRRRAAFARCQGGES